MKITEFKKYETRHVLLESLDKSSRNTYLVWESVGYQLKEAALSPQQIQGLFAEIEKTATAAGANRTLVGKGLDKVNQAIVKPWNDLKAKIYNSGPMQGFAQKYDDAAEKLKQSAGGDEGKVMQAVKKYREFAEKHPIMQGFIYAALIAAAGVSGAGLGGAAALGLFKLTDQLLQGKDIRSALYSAGKTGALAAGASTLGDLVRGGEAAADVAGTDAAVDAGGSQQGAFQGGGTDVSSAIPSSIDDVVADFDGKLSTAEMNLIQDLPNQEGIPQNVIDQYNAQLGPMYDPDGLNLATYQPGQPLTPEQMDGLIDLPNQDNIPDDVIDQYNKQLQSHLDGTTGGVADPDEVSGGTGADRTATAQSGSVSDRVAQGRADLQAKADLVAPGGTGEGIVVRGDIPITDPELIDQFNSQFPGTQAMSPEATQWLKDNVPGAAENLDAKAAAQAERLKNLSPEQLAKRRALLQSGHSTKSNILSEEQVTKLFVAVAYKQTLMEAPGALSKLKQQIGKGVTALGKKARQVGTNITTKITADKLMKAWNKAGKPTDSVQVAQFLQSQGIDGAVMQQSFQTAGIKMPDLKKIASDNPVAALVQQISANPAIKAQVLAYLKAVT